MSTDHISAALRRLVAARADNLCEYCLIHEDDTFFGCEVDHIISLKHGGPTEEDNLAFACLVCNRNKGSDIASLVPGTEDLIRFFNPRTDSWGEHFCFNSADMTIMPLTAIGEATVRILGLNESSRLLERHSLKAVGRYPATAAARRMGQRL